MTDNAERQFTRRQSYYSIFTRQKPIRASSNIIMKQHMWATVLSKLLSKRNLLQFTQHVDIIRNTPRLMSALILIQRQLTFPGFVRQYSKPRRKNHPRPRTRYTGALNAM